jgi:hypothetical protein
MNDTVINPFENTKASSLDDKQIDDLWVDLPSGSSFTDLIKPTSPMPTIILGGKGSGKTHILRYHSLKLQRLRFPGNILEGIQKEGYIGIYLECGGLNASRFSGKGQAEEIWRSVFAYYTDIWFALIFLSGVLEKDDDLKNVFYKYEKDICIRINSLFNKRLPDEPKTFDELIDFLKAKKDKIDYDVNNCVMSGETLKIEILATPGDLILEIPGIIEKTIPELKGTRFVYLIDEYENIKEEQQKYINTLVRERRSPSSLKIGVRLYGLRTRETYSASEQIKSGAEFEEFALDKYFRGKKRLKNYRDFASKLCVRRLKSSFSIFDEIEVPQDAFKILNEYFEKPESGPFEIEQTRFVLDDKYKNEERPYFVRLKRKLTENFRGCEINGVSSKSSINEIISNLKMPDYPLIEKFNVFSIYKSWFQKKDLLEASQEIKSKGIEFADNPGMESEYSSLFKKWKFDLLSQLFRECDKKQKYLGLKTFIELSHGIPRNLLVILKNIYNWSIFNGEEPFKKLKISEDSQLAGVKDASYWFLKDAETPGINFFQTVEPAIRRLCEFFREFRYADKPVEVSLASFSFELAKISEDARKTIEWAEKTSLLIAQENERKDKNSLRVDKTYALNRMLSPMWDLPVARRSVLPLAPNEVEAIFAPKKEDEFKEILNHRRVRMNAPFKELAKQGMLFKGIK